MRRHPPPSRPAFSLIELLVVIGIIALLISLLLPALARSRQQANSITCQANLRSIGQMLAIYQLDNRGWLYPVYNERLTGRRKGFGTNVPPHERWPMKAFKIPGAPLPPPYDPAAYDERIYDPITYPAGPYTPAVLLCPADLEPFEAHSYVLNSHLADRAIKANTVRFGGLTSDQVIVAGEKVTTERDYYMEKGPSNTDFDRVVERSRHGSRKGSNYLYFDGHVGTLLPDEALTGLDPWDLQLEEVPPE